MIEVQHLTKKYGTHLAVEDVSFTVNDGEILGFLGPNGAGKSTCMNILTGYLSATKGDVSIDGYDILQSPAAAKRRIGYLPEMPPLYLDMTVKEYLSYVYELKKVKLVKGPHIEEICRLTKIKDVYHRLIGSLSKGYRQRVGIAQALVGNPKVLILDEPTVGLDPKQIMEVRNLIRMLGKTHTVILSSHILTEVQAVCDRIIIINKGKIIADDTPDRLSDAMSDDHSMSVVIEGDRHIVAKEIAALPGVKSVHFVKSHDNASEFAIDPVVGYDFRHALFSLAAEKNWPILQLQNNQMTLEDIFLRLTDESYYTEGLQKSLQIRKQANEIVDENEQQPVKEEEA